MSANGAPPQGETLPARVLRATRCSWHGLRVAFREEPALRWELLLVPIAELGNTAIETALDRTAPEPHPLVRKAKDIGSAMVMCALLLCAATWLIVLLG